MSVIKRDERKLQVGIDNSINICNYWTFKHHSIVKNQKLKLLFSRID